MKTVFFVLFMTVVLSVKAQYGENDHIGNSSVRLGAGYLHDFPGLNGSALYAEYNFPLNEWLQGGIGAKHVSASGSPRTATVLEYTKSNAIDFKLLFVPLHTENAALRFGLGYTFSFYSIRRSYPVYTQHTADNGMDITWPTADAKGRVHGTSIIGEYEYSFGNHFSAGAKVEACKAFDSIIMGGPFLALQF